MVLVSLVFLHQSSPKSSVVDEVNRVSNWDEGGRGGGGLDRLLEVGPLSLPYDFTTLSTPMNTASSSQQPHTSM